jgi:predicted DNA-binding transcriptional regulator YafY
MSQKVSDLRWGVERRLEFIEFCLFWEGGVNRSDLTGYFGVSVPQASKDLSQYQALAPENVAYNRSEKRYVATPDFRPRFLKPDADHYLSQLRSIANGVLSREETWLSKPPVFEAVPMLHRNVDTEMLRIVLHAIREQNALEIQYQSMSVNRPQPTWRWISPHAFAFDGYRWHVRAFCHIDRIFKDFLLSRFLKIRSTAEAERGPDHDCIWNESIIVILKPHPGLTDDQKRVIAQDFGMKDDRLEVRVRLALLHYLLKQLHLDFQEEQRPAHEQHIVLDNRDEVRRALQRAQDGSSSVESDSPLSAPQ